MDDAIRPNAETFRRYYARGYRTWQGLCLKAVAYREFPADLVDFEHACPKVPYLHNRLELKPGYNFHATGTSTWQASNGDSGCDLPPFQQTYSIPVTARHPIVVSVESSPELFPTWLGGQRNHVCILILAWAYVLSARWSEVVPGTTTLHYTDSQAAWTQSGITTANGWPGVIHVELGPASDGAARWWAAVLAPNQGWATGISYSGRLLPAPWSTNLIQTGKASFLLSRMSTTPPPPHLPPASFSVAASYILAYSAHHGVQDQSRAAFAAALMLPSAGRIQQTVRLFASRPPSSDNSNIPSASPVPGVPVWGHDVRQLDRLLTLSCNNFIQSLLSSAVFEPGIPCNACGAWIQGAFAILGQARADLQVVTGALMARNPELGFLWLGATLLGIHDFVLDRMRALFYPVDLTLAGWTDTLMSFIQESVGDPSPDNETITRADEARLLFLSQSIDHTQLPIVPFQPFGLTAIADCNLEVQEHARCRRSHALYYSNWKWDCQDRAHAPTPQRPLTLLDKKTADDSQIRVDYSHMDREKDVSEAITRSIFMWLRGTDGFPIAEQKIREHEWINNLDESDDESASPEGDGRSIGAKGNATVGSWIARAVTYRRNSFY
ncbi:hypothetical protein V8F33_009042 [Rhypophila sp. PSN 637]